MAVITHTVAAAHVPAVRRSLLELYAVKAEALTLEVERFLIERSDAADVERHRLELRRLDGLLASLGWTAMGEERDVSLRGDRAFLIEGYTAALSGAVDAIAADLADASSPPGDLGGCLAGLRNAHGLAAALQHAVSA